MEESNSDSKVIHSGAKRNAALPLVLGDVQEGVLKTLERQLRICFLETHDMLYEMELSQESLAEDLQYFDGSKALRVKKSDIIQDVLISVSQRFIDLVDDSHEPEDSGSAKLSGMKLVKDEAFNQNMQLHSVASLVTRRHQQSVDDLTSRLNHVLLQVQVTPSTLPLNASSIADAFINSYAQHCALSINVRRILFKNFCKNVIESFDITLSAANKVLTDAGVLPQLDEKDVGIASTDSGTTSEFDTFENVDLEQTHREPSISSRNPSKAAGEAEHQRSPDARNHNKGHGQFVTADTLEAKTGHTAAASKNDQLAIANSVLEFFSTCMQGDDVPALAKKAIYQLQIPFLQEALASPAVFTKESHPARRLILQMVSMAIQAEHLPEPQRIALQARMQSAANEVAENYRGDSRTFLDAYYKLINGL